jgi:hypothetical protein
MEKSEWDKLKEGDIIIYEYDKITAMVKVTGRLLNNNITGICIETNSSSLKVGDRWTGGTYSKYKKIGEDNMPFWEDLMKQKLDTHNRIRELNNDLDKNEKDYTDRKVFITKSVLDFENKVKELDVLIEQASKFVEKK